MDHRLEFFTVSRVCEITGLMPDMLDEVESTFSDHLDVRRTDSGNRLFSSRDVDRLQEIRRMVDDEGLSLEQVKASLFPPEPVQPHPADTLPAWSGSLDSEPMADGPDAPLTAQAEAEATHSEPGETPEVPELPLAPTVDLLLEAAEGLVQENLKLRQAVDTLGERFTRLETHMAGGGGFLQRLFGRR